jgi:hypothetical protein
MDSVHSDDSEMAVMDLERLHLSRLGVSVALRPRHFKALNRQNSFG